MEKERTFNFKLLVPPRISKGQISAVKPQGVIEDSCGSKQPIQTFNKYPDKDFNMPFPNTSMVAPSKSAKTDAVKKVAVMPMEKEEKTWKSRDLYSKLFEEADKIKWWKVKVESEIAQKEKQELESLRTIENQRKVIQELQFGNEHLSMKLEDKMRENADLKNKSCATRNLCNILKDTFQRSAEKMNLYESEREETHHLFMQNSENIQRMVTAFEDLRVQAETDRLEMLKLKEGVQEYEDVKEKFQKEFKIRQKEAIVLQEKVNSKDDELQQTLKNLRETQQRCAEFQRESKLQHEMLHAYKQKQEGLYEELQRAHESSKEKEENCKALENTFKEREKEYENVLKVKENILGELLKIKEEQAEKNVKTQTIVQELQDSLTSEVQRSKELEETLSSISEEMKMKINELGEIEDQKDEKERQLQILKDDVDNKLKSITLLQDRLKKEETKASQLSVELVGKNAEIFQLKTELCEHEEQLSVALRNKENSSAQIDKLKKEIEQHEVKYEELMTSVNKLHVQKETLEQQVKNGATKAQSLEIQLKENKENENKIKKKIERLELENDHLRGELDSSRITLEKQDAETKKMEEKYKETNKSLQNDLLKKEKQIKDLDMKLNTINTKAENKNKVRDEYLKENRNLRKQMETESEKCSLLETKVNEMKEEFKKAQILKDEELKNLHVDIEMKIATEGELRKQIQNLNLTEVEAVKSKEEAEIKCQHKISDMVALMEKHKNQYDKMVEEKDAELDDRRRKEVEIIANKMSLELELSEMKIENSNLKQQLDNEIKERENLKQQVKALNKKFKSLKVDMEQGLQNVQTPENKFRGIGCSASPKTAGTFKSIRKSVFDFSNETNSETTVKTPAHSSVKKIVATPRVKEGAKETLKTPKWTPVNKYVVTPRIKSYRIRTPPSAGKSVPWRKSTLELDPKSDSSEQNDLLNFSIDPEPFKSILNPGHSGKQCQYGDPFKKSPTVSKSPGTALKLAAVKRMRDAGWTAVTNRDRKKKKASEKIFA